MRFVTDPSQAREVKMRDGTTYPVGVGGSFVVTDARHVSELERGNHDYFTSAVALSAGGGNSCACGFRPWPWQMICPHCGSPNLVGHASSDYRPDVQGAR